VPSSQKKNEFRFFPNPVTNELTLQNPGIKDTKLTVTDMNGKIVIKADLPVGTSQINVKVLSPGTYILYCDGCNSGQSFIKQ
jgi:hypothetical protein